MNHKFRGYFREDDPPESYTHEVISSSVEITVQAQQALYNHGFTTDFLIAEAHGMIRWLRWFPSVCFLVVALILAGCGGSEESANQRADRAPVDPTLKQVVESIRQADEDIQAEQVKNNLRVGVALTAPSTIHRGNSVESDTADASHQLRVVLRQEQTKQALPGASVEAQFLDEAGRRIRTVFLSETWGPYLFHGWNVSIPSDAEQLTVLVEPSMHNRHESMKAISKSTFTVSFDLSSRSNGWTVEGSKPSPVASDYTLGNNVQLALAEPLEMKTKSSYKIGLITEQSEPFWIPHDHAGQAHMHRAEIPEDANRHMEFILLDEATNRIIPNANLTMRLVPEGDGDVIETELPFLLATFNHYGNNLHVLDGTYEMTITIDRPRLSYLEEERFPSTVTETFQWSSGTSGKENEESGS